MAFLFLEVPSEARDVFEQIGVPGKLEPKGKYHITVLFLGDDYPAEGVVKATEAALNVTRKTAPFQVSTRLITTFPAGDDGVPIIARIESPDLIRFQASIREAFDASGIEYSKKYPEYKPHMTLSYGDAPMPDKPISQIGWMVNELVLQGGKEGDTKRIKTTLPLERDMIASLRVASRFQRGSIP